MPADKLIIRDLRLEASVGIYPAEQQKRQPVLINIEAEVERPSSSEDKIENVVCYETIVIAIRGLLNSRHFNLVETMAEEISAVLLKDKRVHSAKIRVKKTAVFDDVGGVGIEIFREQKKA